MGTLFRFFGSIGFFVILFLPTLDGCGEHSQFKIAAGWSYAGALMFLAALGFAFLAFVSPLSKKKPTPAGEAFVMLLATTFTAAVAYYAYVALEWGATLRRALYWQEGFLGLIFLGAFLRWRRARRPN